MVHSVSAADFPKCELRYVPFGSCVASAQRAVRICDIGAAGASVLMAATRRAPLR
jgi:hypothetical protein